MGSSATTTAMQSSTSAADAARARVRTTMGAMRILPFRLLPRSAPDGLLGLGPQSGEPLLSLRDASLLEEDVVDAVPDEGQRRGRLLPRLLAGPKGGKTVVRLGRSG